MSLSMFVRVCVRDYESNDTLGLILNTFCAHVFGQQISVKFVRGHNRLSLWKMIRTMKLSRKASQIPTRGFIVSPDPDSLRSTKSY